MSRRLDLLRLDYVFSVIIPCLLPIYLHNLTIKPHLDIIIGFFLYAITGNTLNDAIDMRDPNEKDTLERVKGYNWKELIAVAVVSFAFGTTLFIRTIISNWINGLYLVLTVVIVIVYCFKKNIPIINQVLLAISHVIFPYLIIKTDAGLIPPVFLPEEWFMMINFLSFAFTGQMVHEIIDGDAITKFSPKVQQISVIISSLITIILGIIATVLLDDIYFLPFALIPIGTLYIFRRPTRSTKGVKDVGIILGNIILLYLIVLIVIS